ncbi:MAG: hypothetical protein NUV69_01605 [Candidatus Curtissbacteria bacterium]|nr:hypothetical protein [Candidatus Curtissbacteria bacterium]
MTATAHALIGASLAVKFVNPYVGIPLAIISHFLADLVPHWDAGTNRRKKTIMRLRMEATVDVLLGFVLVFLIFGRMVEPVYLFVMVIAAQLPDWVEAPSSKFGIHIPPFSWVEWLGHRLQNRMQLPWGFVTQVVVVGVIVIAALTTEDLGSILATRQ